MSTIEEKINVARNLLLQIEAQNSQSITLARKALGELEDDARELRREALKRNTEFFTEQELASKVGVSRKTIERKRKRGELVPCDVGGPLRYSNAHLEQLAQIPDAAAARKRHHNLKDVTKRRA